MSWQIDLVDGVAVVTMNTNKANAQNEHFFADLHEALDRLDREPPSTGIVLTGQGSIFSAGIDLKYSLPLFATQDLRAIREWFARYRATNVRLFGYPRPTVAAINGHAFAGGVITALCCDYRIAAEGPARFALNEVPIGIPMPPVYSEIIRYAIGTPNATLATLFGQEYDVDGARRIGFVHETVAPDKLIEAAVQRANLSPPMRWPPTPARSRASRLPHLRILMRWRHLKMSGWLRWRTREICVCTRPNTKSSLARNFGGSTRHYPVQCTSMMRPDLTLASAALCAAVGLVPQSAPHRPDPTAKAAQPFLAHVATVQPRPYCWQLPSAMWVASSMVVALLAQPVAPVAGE